VLPVRSKEQANGLNVIQILLSKMGKLCQIKKKNNDWHQNALNISNVILYNY
jgi:hypothetical protein